MVKSPLAKKLPGVLIVSAPVIPLAWIAKIESLSGEVPVGLPKSTGTPNGTGYTVLSRLTEPVFALMPALSPTSMISPEASLKST
jgi:hypothetical protein